MTHSTQALAAIASAALPGLDPVSVRELATRRRELFQVALVTDERHRHWVVRVPRTAAAGAELDQTQSLTTFLDRRLPYALPVPQGFLDLPGVGRASVSPFIPGHPLVLSALPAEGSLAAQVGRAIGALHELDPLLLDEVAAPSYDTQSYRRRRVSDLDRAAQTGRVPTGLLERWEHALEEDRLWEFTTCPVHGGLMGRNLLATFPSEVAEDGRITGVTGWEGARVADPADDFAWLIGQCTPETWRAVRAGYAETRADGVDAYLEVRARLAAELHLMTSLLGAMARGEEELADVFAEKLRYLDYDISAGDTPLVPDRGQRAEVAAPSAALTDEEADDGEDATTEGSDSDAAGTPDATEADAAAEARADHASDDGAGTSSRDAAQPGGATAVRSGTRTTEPLPLPRPAEAGAAPGQPSEDTPTDDAARPRQDEVPAGQDGSEPGEDAAFEVSPDPSSVGFVPVTAPPHGRTAGATPPSDTTAGTATATPAGAPVPTPSLRSEADEVHHDAASAELYDIPVEDRATR